MRYIGLILNPDKITHTPLYIMITYLHGGTLYYIPAMKKKTLNVVIHHVVKKQQLLRWEKEANKNKFEAGIIQ